MPDSGNVEAGTVAAVPGPGANWTNDTNARIEDDSMAAVPFSPAPGASDILRFTDHDYSGVPSGYALVGIECIAKAYHQTISGTNAATASCQLRRKSGNAGSPEATPTFPAGDESEDAGLVIAGGPSELWGTSFTTDEINSTLGINVDVTVNCTGTGIGVSYIDVVYLKLYWVVPGGGVASSLIALDII